MKLKDFLEKHGEVELTEEKEKQIKDLLGVKKSKRWEPNDDEMYYYINSNGDVDYNYYDCENNIFSYFTNNCFKTEEEAEFYLETLKVYYELKNFADENGEKIDWKNDNQTKYTFLLDYEDNKFTYDSAVNFRRISCIYFTSKELIEQAIEKVGEDRIKKYLFGVE